MAFLALHEVSKRYGATRALVNVSLELTVGGFYLLRGPNGAGKSTLLRCCSGLERVDHGTVSVADLLLSRAADYRSFLQDIRPAYLGAQTQLYRDLTVKENLELTATLLNLPDRAHALAAMYEAFNLHSFLGRQLNACSQGMQRRTALARALLGEPRLVLLDEPLVNLDQEASDACLAELYRLHATGATLVVASHSPMLFAVPIAQILEMKAGEVLS
jgi:ABC-type multidrug transport system ATPase subunit